MNQEKVDDWGSKVFYCIVMGNFESMIFVRPKHYNLRKDQDDLPYLKSEATILVGKWIIGNRALANIK